MVRRQASALSDRAKSALATCKNAVAAETGRVAKAGIARSRFRAKSAAASWREIRGKLSRARPIGTRCHYCELDRPRDIDHVYPLSVYPDEAFDYANYVYSCVICNQNRKRERCSHVVDDEIRELGHFCRVDDELPVGVRGLINPRTEDPLEFMEIDIETGALILIPQLNSTKRLRAEYTIDVLNLNEPNLARDRRSAAKLYLDYAADVAAAITAEDTEMFERIIYDFLDVDRPTVLMGLLNYPNRYPDFHENLRVIVSDLDETVERLFAL